MAKDKKSHSRDQDGPRLKRGKVQCSVCGKEQKSRTEQPVIFGANSR